jgi:hypothetical protein
MTVFSTWQYRNGAASLGKIERLRRLAWLVTPRVGYLAPGSTA